ncbi:MAG: IMP dehydrogenase [Verrucomicrobiota bacterium]
MAVFQAVSAVDAGFYQPADTFFPAHRDVALTYDDVSLATLYSEVLPRDTQLGTQLSEGLSLNIPIISADMDTVTESRMAIAMALNGGLGLLHANMPERTQLSEVSRVKNHVHGLIQEPIKVSPEQSIGDVLAMMADRNFSFGTFPVVDTAGRLVGLLPGHVVKNRYAARRVAEVLTPRAQVQTINRRELRDDPILQADQFFSDHPGFHKLLVVDDEDRLHGLFTLSDVDQIIQERKAQFKPARDARLRLICGAAVAAPRNAAGELDRSRILNHVGALVERGLDVVAVSTAHGHTRGVGESVRLVRDAFPRLPIIAGNVTSAAGVEFLAGQGATTIKVGQGPGSICTTRLVAGVGIPQLTALYTASRAAAERKVTLIADGGITKSGDIVKALTLAHAVICGGLLAGCPESPGQVLEINGKLYKQYRGMGSLAAMKAGSAARYGHASDPARKMAAEGVEALKEAAPSVDAVLTQLIGGIQSGLGYLGASNLAELRARARFVRIGPGGLREAGTHDVVEIKTAE